MAKQIEVLTKKDIRDLSVVGGGTDILDWVLYDTLVIANAGTQTSFKFFQQSVGPNGITLAQTNMDIPAQLPNGVKFVAQKIVLQVQKPAAMPVTAAQLTDEMKITHQGVAQFIIGTRPYLQLPTQALLGGGFSGFASAFDASTAAAYAAGRSIVNGEMEYSPVIPSTFNFSVQVDFPAAPSVAANQSLRCCIVGKLLRPRQG
jgi:hypothetical protein